MNKLQTLLTAGLVTLSFGASAKDTYPDITDLKNGKAHGFIRGMRVIGFCLLFYKDKFALI